MQILLVMPGYIPVSYTHLDVYKRQDIYSASIYDYTQHIIVMYFIVIEKKLSLSTVANTPSNARIYTSPA